MHFVCSRLTSCVIKASPGWLCRGCARPLTFPGTYSTSFKAGREALIPPCLGPSSKSTQGIHRVKSKGG